MNAKKVAIVIGTRPDAIKMAPLILELKKFQDINVEIISTGQHADLLKPILRHFQLAPDHNLHVMRDRQSLSGLTALLLRGFEDLFRIIRPDLVLCHGDTTSTFSAGLSCYYHHIPMMHVESGLRSHDLSSPFPEEFNRRFFASFALHHFAPTDKERKNLIADGVESTRISVVGNTIADSVYLCLPHGLTKETKEGFNILVTLHRRERSKTMFSTLLRSLGQFVLENQDAVLTFPIHPNPELREEARDILAHLPRTNLILALNYPEFLCTLAKSDVVVTDSGGVQEEAFLLGKKTLIVREKTERDDGLASGLIQLVSEHDVSVSLHRIRVSQEANKHEGARGLFRRDFLAERIGASKKIAQIVRERL